MTGFMQGGRLVRIVAGFNKPLPPVAKVPYSWTLFATRPHFVRRMAETIPDPSGAGSLERVVTGRQSVLYKKPRKDEDMKEVDLRSDTVTKPTDEMRVAMFEAEVGDDVFRDDPTVLKLESRAAQMLGKEAALFVPSGTMGNLLCALTHCTHRGDEILLGDDSHISHYEQGGVSWLGGIHTRIVTTLLDGTLDLADIKRKIMSNDIHCPKTQLLCLENTHNRKGGQVLTPQYMEQAAQTVAGRGIKIHLDGARLFNAATALKVPVAKLTEHVDTVSVCLSKGLGAPAGSLIAGDKEFISRAQRLRKGLGGGMRQIGVLAAPGLVALEKMSLTLQDDHDNARHLAVGLSKLSSYGVEVNLPLVKTNIVNFDLVREDMNAARFVELCVGEGVKMLAFSDVMVRCVTHHDVTRAGVELALKVMRSILQQ